MLEAVAVILYFEQWDLFCKNGGKRGLDNSKSGKVTIEVGDIEEKLTVEQ